jgi:hypothetical protein
MTPRNALYGMVFATTMLVASIAHAKDVSLICTNGGVSERVVFDEGAGTAGMGPDENNLRVRPATFTDTKITWNDSAPFDGTHLSYLLDRETGKFTIYFADSGRIISAFQCSVAKPEF